MATLGIPSNTIAVLQKYGFHFQKKYGQNFLVDSHILEKIVEASEIGKEDCVLEVGPGIGTMTQYLAEHAGHVIAVEIDANLIPILEDTLSAYDNITVIHGDILKTDVKKLCDTYNGGKLLFWLQICLIILPRLLLWDFLRAMCRFILLRSWCKRKWRTECR